MKAVIKVAAVLAVAAVLMGCATSYPVGGIYTKLSLPVNVGDQNAKAMKIGTAECTSILSMVATGDVSIQTAMKNGGITKVHHVDWDVENILGIIGKYKVTVYGE